MLGTAWGIFHRFIFTPQKNPETELLLFPHFALSKVTGEEVTGLVGPPQKQVLRQGL